MRWLQRVLTRLVYVYSVSDPEDVYETTAPYTCSSTWDLQRYGIFASYKRVTCIVIDSDPIVCSCDVAAEANYFHSVPWRQRTLGT